LACINAVWRWHNVCIILSFSDKKQHGTSGFAGALDEPEGEDQVGANKD
jgi:hypothetical protein